MHVHQALLFEIEIDFTQWKWTQEYENDRIDSVHKDENVKRQ